MYSIGPCCCLSEGKSPCKDGVRGTGKAASVIANTVSRDVNLVARKHFPHVDETDLDRK